MSFLYLLGHNNQAFDNTIGKVETLIRNVCQQQSCHHLRTIFLHIHFKNIFQQIEFGIVLHNIYL
jgi:hypothetical protein